MTYEPTKEYVERAARVLAELDGIAFDAAPKNKQEWTRKRGMFGGRFRDVNEPMQSDFLESAEAVLLAHHRALAERGVFVVEWKPIETAPKDGTVVWVYVAARSEGVQEELPAFQTCCAYHPDAGWCADELREVTHWMPLLPEPKP